MVAIPMGEQNHRDLSSAALEKALTIKLTLDTSVLLIAKWSKETRRTIHDHDEGEQARERERERTRHAFLFMYLSLIRNMAGFQTFISPTLLSLVHSPLLLEKRRSDTSPPH